MSLLTGCIPAYRSVHSFPEEEALSVRPSDLSVICSLSADGEVLGLPSSTRPKEADPDGCEWQEWLQYYIKVYFHVTNLQASRMCLPLFSIHASRLMDLAKSDHVARSALTPYHTAICFGAKLLCPLKLCSDSVVGILLHSQQSHHNLYCQPYAAKHVVVRCSCTTSKGSSSSQPIVPKFATHSAINDLTARTPHQCILQFQVVMPISSKSAWLHKHCLHCN